MKRLILFCWLMLIQPLYSQVPFLSNEFRKAEAEQKNRIAKKILANQEYARAEFVGWDITCYALDLYPDIATETLYGRVKVTGIVGNPVMEWAGLSLWSGIKINCITLFTNPADTLEYLQKNETDILLIKLNRVYNQGEEICLLIDYQGRPQDSGYNAFDFGFYLNKPMIWTLSEPFGAKSWWPCKDTAIDKPDSMDIRITVPNEFTVVSNGSLRSRITDGDYTTWWWHEQYPIATYLVSLAIYPYEIHYDYYLYNNRTDTMQIQFYNFPGVYEQYKDEMKKVKNMMALFSRLFGEYPFIKEKYAQADFAGGGAMEHQTCSSFSFFGEAVYVHELAHQWWGDLITCSDFHHIWLNEGFATYSEALWYEWNYPDMTASQYQMNANYFIGHGTIYVEDPEHENIFDGGLSYAKASWVLHMLRHVVGDSMFFHVLREYAKSPLHSYGSATSEDFKAICEELSGLDLELFFKQWIYEEGCPHYQYSWNWDKTASGLYRVFGHIKQMQTFGPVFAMPLDITIEMQDGDTTFVLINDQKDMDFEYLVTALPEMVLLDKENWILKQISGNFTPCFVLLDYSVDDSQMNNNTLVDAGETITLLIQVQNTGVKAVNLQFQLYTDDPDITIIDDAFSTSIPERYAGEIIEIPFTFSVSPAALGHLAEFRLNISTGNHFRQSLYFKVAVNLPHILFVDDDNGRNYDDSIEAVLTRNYIPYGKWDVSCNGPADLQNAGIVIWSTGADQDSALTAGEQQLIAAYLHNNGKLLLTGQKTSYDLAVQGSAADSAFLRDYLHARYLDNKIESDLVLGVKDDPLGDHLRFNLRAPEASQYSPDVIAPLEPARSFLYYSTTQQCAGLYYHNQDTGAKVIYLPFGFEGVSDELNQESAGRFFKRALQWFSEPFQASPILQQQKNPAMFQLYPNYPNPFNAQTCIHFDLSEACFVTLQIYNILGRLVAEPLRENKSPGAYSVKWNGRDDNGMVVPGGVYIYKMAAGEYKAVRKMLLIR